MPEPSILGRRVRFLRRERELSQRTLAGLCGVHFMTIWRLENGGAQTVSSEVLQKLCDLFEVPADYLLGRTDRRKGMDPEDTEELLAAHHA